MQKKDPEAALEMLKELEKARIEERMSLRHKKSKWAQFQGTRATRDTQVCVCVYIHLSIIGASGNDKEGIFITDNITLYISYIPYR